MQAYLVDVNGFYIKEISLIAGESVPPRVVFTAPPAESEYTKPRWVGNQWKLANPVDFITQSQTTEPEPEPTAPLIEITINNVMNTLAGFDDGSNQYTVNEQTDITVNGTLAIPDQNFRVPFKRTDTGRIQLMPANVVSGEFTLTLNFKTGGIWVVDDEQVNSAYDTPVFSIIKQTFMVI